MWASHKLYEFCNERTIQIVLTVMILQWHKIHCPLWPSYKFMRNTVQFSLDKVYSYSLFQSYQG